MKGILMTADERAIDHIHSITTKYQEDKNRYKVQIVFYINGKRNSVNYIAKTEEKCKEKIEKLILNVFTDNLILLSPDIKFKHFSSVWLQQIYSHKVKHHVLQDRINYFNNYINPYIGDLPINNISYSDIQSFVNNMADNGSTSEHIRKGLSLIRGCFKYFCLLTENSLKPCDGITVFRNNNKRAKKINCFNSKERTIIEEYAFMVDESNNFIHRFGPAIVMLMYTGLRFCEAAALTWNDIDFHQRTISINKSTIEVTEKGSLKFLTRYGSKTPCSLRTIPMTLKAKWCLIELKKQSNGSEYVICTKDGAQVNRHTFYNAFNRLLTHSQLISKGDSRGVHSLRHTFATMLFENGCNVKVISELLGHSSTKTTETVYIHVIQKLKAKAINDLDKYCG